VYWDIESVCHLLSVSSGV